MAFPVSVTIRWYSVSSVYLWPFSQISVRRSAWRDLNSFPRTVSLMVVCWVIFVSFRFVVWGGEVWGPPSLVKRRVRFAGILERGRADFCQGSCGRFFPAAVPGIFAEPSVFSVASFRGFRFVFVLSFLSPSVWVKKRRPCGRRWCKKNPLSFEGDFLEKVRLWCSLSVLFQKCHRKFSFSLRWRTISQKKTFVKYFL